MDSGYARSLRVSRHFRRKPCFVHRVELTLVIRNAYMQHIATVASLGMCNLATGKSKLPAQFEIHPMTEEDSLMETETRSRLKGGLAALALAAAISSVGPTGPAAATTCQAEWNKNPVELHCSDPTLLLQAIDTCDISVSCSYTFTYGPGGNSSATVTPSLLLAVFDLTDVSLITFCVKETTDSDGEVTYSARLDSACRTNEYGYDDVEGGQFHD